MTALRQAIRATIEVRDACAQSARVFVSDAGHGLLEIGHNSLALVGLGVVTAGLFVAGHDDVRSTIETHALGWLQARQEARVEPGGAAAPAVEVVTVTPAAAATTLVAAAPDSDAPSPSSVAATKDLTREQSAVVQWLARRYRVAPEPIGRLVREAWNLAPRVGLDPTLVLAIMAVESSFNPFAQSSVGAQGLMQVMTSVHNGKYQRFGGTLAAFDPVANLKVGVQVLKECIARAGSVEAGLRHYVGAANLTDDGGYASKVLAEQGYLRSVALGNSVAPNARAAAALPRAVRAAAPAAGGSPAMPAAEREDTAAPPAPAEEIHAPEQVALVAP